jgi:hypothetical protein
MKLRNGDKAIIDPRKIIEYCLNLEHDDGKRKAKLLLETCGLELKDADKLLQALRAAAAYGEADRAYHQRLMVDFELDGPTGKLPLRSAWIIRPDESIPRFVTCLQLKKKERPMVETRPPKLLDLVAVLNNPHAKELEVGDVGTVVELLPPNGVEVEFLDRLGHTRCLVTFRTEDLLVLNRDRTPLP